MTAKSGKFEAPMECAEEGEHDGSIGLLDMQSLMKERDGYTWIQVWHHSYDLTG